MVVLGAELLWPRAGHSWSKKLFEVSRNNKKANAKIRSFYKKVSFRAPKDAVSDAAAKVSETVQKVDVGGKVAIVGETIIETSACVTETVKMVDAASTLVNTKETLIEASERTLETAQFACQITKEKSAW